MSESEPKKSQKPTALITGATGFVGKHLSQRLVKDGWRVHIVSRTDCQMHKFKKSLQVTNHTYDSSTESLVNCVAKAKPDVVFHLASLFLSQHATNEVCELIKSNVMFGCQLLEAMKVNQVKLLVNTGTSWQHYNNQDYNPVCLYAATKQAFEAILEFYVQTNCIKAITLKLFDTYGPADPRPKLFHLLEKAANSGELLNMSAGEQLIDIVHIEDVVEAFLIAANRLLQGKASLSESYAVSSTNPLPLKKLVEIYSKETGKQLNINWGARDYRYREVMTTWTNGKAIEGWSPKINLKAGLQMMNFKTMK